MLIDFVCRSKLHNTTKVNGAFYPDAYHLTVTASGGLEKVRDRQRASTWRQGAPKQLWKQNIHE